jgi:arylsulfatase
MAIYAAMVDRMDQNIGRVLSDLDRQGELDNTLIIFTSDNGACAEWDAFGFDIKSGPQNILHRGDQIDRMGSKSTYHSVGSGWANASNTPWRLYKHFNHEGGIAVPCIIHWPAATEEAAGTISDSPTHLIDLVPTALSAAGAPSTGSTTTRSELSAPTALPGRSLLPLLQGKGIAATPLYFEHEGNRAVRDGRWKLVALRNQPWELYDMQVDRLELNDLAADRPALVRRLSAMWEQWAAANHVTPLPTDYEVEYLPSQ